VSRSRFDGLSTCPSIVGGVGVIAAKQALNCVAGRAVFFLAASATPPKDHRAQSASGALSQKLIYRLFIDEFIEIYL
jgi:hypothetical protein